MWPRKCRNTPYIKDLGYYNDYDIIPGLYFAYYDIAKFEMNISKTTYVFFFKLRFLDTDKAWPYHLLKTVRASFFFEH